MTNVNVIERTALVRNFVENNPNPNPEATPVTILNGKQLREKFCIEQTLVKCMLIPILILCLKKMKN